MLLLVLWLILDSFLSRFTSFSLISLLFYFQLLQKLSKNSHIYQNRGPNTPSLEKHKIQFTRNTDVAWNLRLRISSACLVLGDFDSFLFSSIDCAGQLWKSYIDDSLTGSLTGGDGTMIRAVFVLGQVGGWIVLWREGAGRRFKSSPTRSGRNRDQIWWKISVKRWCPVKRLYLKSDISAHTIL